MSLVQQGSQGDTPVPYGGEVDGERQVDRAAWADLVGQMVVDEGRGNQAAFARLIKVAPKTVGRWLRKEVAVSERSVRDVARAIGRSPLDLLIEVGYYQRDEARTVVETETEDDIAVAPDFLEIIRPLPPDEQRQFIARYKATMLLRQLDKGNEESHSRQQGAS